MKEELLVLGKAYPTISKKYELLVCVAGITANGEWRRIYPIPWKIFWKYSESKFKKKQWIRYELRDNKPSDRRPESRKIKFETIEVLHEESFKNIKKMLDDRLNTLEELQEKDDTQVSLSVLKPKIIDIVWEDWDYYTKVGNLMKQTTLDIMDGVKKSPVKIDFPDRIFRFVFKCSPNCPKEHRIMCEDWELGMLYLNVLKRYKDKEKASQIVRSKLLELQKEHKYIYFGVGTHNRYKNTWLIGSILYPKKEELKEIEIPELSKFFK